MNDESLSVGLTHDFSIQKRWSDVFVGVRPDRTVGVRPDRTTFTLCYLHGHGP